MGSLKSQVSFANKPYKNRAFSRKPLESKEPTNRLPQRNQIPRGGKGQNAKEDEKVCVSVRVWVWISRERERERARARAIVI